MSSTAKVSKPPVVEIRKLDDLDLDKDGKITENEVADFYANRVGDQKTAIKYDGKTYANWEEFKQKLLSDGVIAESSSGKEPASLKQETADAIDEFKRAKIGVDNMQSELDRLTNLKPDKLTDQIRRRIETLKQQLAFAKAAMQQKLTKAYNSAMATGHADEIKEEWLKAAGMDSKINDLRQKQTQKSAGTLNIPLQAMKKGNVSKAMTSEGFTPPSGWGKTVGNSSLDFARSALFQNLNLSAFEDVLRHTKEGERLQQLLYYAMRMAESGDMGAMYNLMKIVSFIISKDKALQQIDMSKKLIELQNTAREWTNKLLNTDSKDSDAFSKMMMQSKSETDAIATSQKLIAQMMEEMAQVVETMTNTTKAALEAHGRILRTVSRVG